MNAAEIVIEMQEPLARAKQHHRSAMESLARVSSWHFVGEDEKAFYQREVVKWDRQVEAIKALLELLELKEAL